MPQTAYNVNSYNHTNTAYQSTEAPRRRSSVPPQARKKPELRVEKGGKPRLSPVLWAIGHMVQIVAVALLVGLSVNLLRSEATINELNNEIQKARTQLVSLESQGNYYTSVLNSKTSISNVDEAAGRLGLMKVNESQITYVFLGSSSVIVRKEPAVPGWTDIIHAGALMLESFTR